MSKTNITSDDILHYIESFENGITRHVLARAFDIKGTSRIFLKNTIRDLMELGLIRKSNGKYFKNNKGELVIVEIVEINKSGTITGIPTAQLFTDKSEKITIEPIEKTRKFGKSIRLIVGNRALVQVRKADNKLFGKFIQLIENLDSKRVIGEFRSDNKGAWLVPSDKKIRETYAIAGEFTMNAVNGDIVVANVTINPRTRRIIAEVVEVIGKLSDPSVISLIAIYDNHIPNKFSHEAIKLADTAQPASIKGREDLRHIPFVTIDGEDARDFDDAVWAEPDLTPGNPGGWHAMVAIADVAHYVLPGDALDVEAKERGNSVYFPDRVVPMLPESLSNGLCSLRPNEDRAAIAVHLNINQSGKTIGFKFVRCLIKSSARMTYNQVQKLKDANQLKEPLVSLYGVYDSLMNFRHQRGTLELDIPEKYIALNAKGTIESVSLRERFDSHKLIEELMIAANVAAAKLLSQKAVPCMYRIHDKPDLTKIASLKTFLKGTSIKPPSSLEPNQKELNKVIEQAKDTKYADVISELVLRSQCQAEYSPNNIGHFGLNLSQYAHFTSPIRRYSDTLVHRGIITAMEFGIDGLNTKHPVDFKAIGQHLGLTERRAAIAERDTKDRMVAAFMVSKVGETFTARISTVTGFGLFAIIDQYAATGLIHISKLKGDYFTFDEDRRRLFGRRGKQSFQMGDMISVKVEGANPLTGSIELSINNQPYKKK